MLKKNDSISAKQISAIAFVSLLSPIIRILPHHAVDEAGNAAWLSPLFAVPLMIVFQHFMLRFMKTSPENGGLGDVFLQSLGNFFGKTTLFIYFLWFSFYAGFLMRSGAERFISTIYPKSRPWAFIIIMLVISLMAALGRLRVLARTAEIFRPLLAGVFALVFILTIPSIRSVNILPVTYLDAPSLCLSSLSIINVFSVGAYLCFLAPWLGKERMPPVFKGWGGAMVVISVFLCLTSLGVFGAELTTHLSHPFFSMIKGVSLKNILERMEAFIIVMWVIADFTLVTIMFFINAELLRLIFGIKTEHSKIHGAFELREGRWAIWLCAFLSLAVAMSMSDSITLDMISEKIIPKTHAIFVFVGFPAVFIIGAIKRSVHKRRSSKLKNDTA